MLFVKARVYTTKLQEGLIQHAVHEVDSSAQRVT